MGNPTPGPDYAAEAYKACLYGRADAQQQQSVASALILANADRGRLLEALEALRLQALQSELNSPANEWGWEALQLANVAIARATGAA